jgi:hypothetical protein
MATGLREQGFAATASGRRNVGFGSKTVLAAGSAERQLTPQFRTESLRRGSRQFG